jgi:DNA-binding GntR family transcriptional regulator
MASATRLHATPLERVSTVEALTKALRDRVLDGTLAADTPLREAELCEVFGVSRHTVRTALRALGHEGLARLEPNRGAFVPELTADDVDDLFRLRSALELTAVRTLAQEPRRRGGGGGGGGGTRPTDAARRAAQALQGIPEDASWTAVRDADLDFHRALVDALASPRVTRTYAALMTELRLSFLQLQQELEDHRDVARQHTEILDAIESGDAGEAARLLQVHLDEARENIAGAYRSRARRPPSRR